MVLKMMMKIMKKKMINIIKKQCNNFYERKGFKPEIIVVHISAGSLSSMDSWFANPLSNASAHYGIGRDGVTIHQYVEEDKAAWANGAVSNPTFKLYKPNVNPNLYSISIENEGQDLMLAPAEQLNLLCELIKDICKRHNIPMDRDHIIGHYEINALNRPNCPSSTHAIIDIIYFLNKRPPIVSHYGSPCSKSCICM